jgi:hypothetical protein
MSDLTPITPNHPIYQALNEIQRSRSRFQLEHFVAGQHDTDEQQYRQILLEIQSLIFSIKNAQLKIKKGELEVAKLRKDGDEIDAVEAEIMELGLEQSRLVLSGAEKELADLVDMWEKFPHKYTAEELEKLQPVYWEARLMRQAQLEALGSNGKIGWGALDALRQIGKLSIDEEVAELERKSKEIE